ncbi:MAG: hypothetical protein ACR2RB_20890 [Gammaproteobacteria bacterium]
MTVTRTIEMFGVRPMLKRLTPVNLRHAAIASCFLAVTGCADIVVEPVAPPKPAKTADKNQSANDLPQPPVSADVSKPATEKSGKEMTDAPLPPAATPVSQPATGQTTKQVFKLDDPQPTVQQPVATEKAGKDQADTQFETVTEAASQPLKNAGWVIVTGSYYPREIKHSPELGAETLLLARPGTRLQSLGLADGWYKVITDQGEGYVSESDVRLE